MPIAIQNSPFETPSPELLREDDRTLAHDRDAVFGEQRHGARQDTALDVATKRDEVLGTTRVGNANNVLIDDGTFVEFSGHEVRGRANEFDASLVRLVIGTGALEAREK